VSRLRCSYCEERVKGKPASLYWAWFPLPGERVAYKTRSCPECLTSHFKALLQTSSSTSTDDDTCIACGGSSEADEAVVYLTLYLPKREALSYELVFDAPCAVKTYATISDVGERLPDRGARDGGPETPHPDPWASLEL